MTDRMPALPDSLMSAEQRAAAAELAAGPRGGVRGPFVPLLRSPELMSRFQKVGEYLRFRSVLAARIREFATLVVSRHWTQQFEWHVHYPLALQAGLPARTAEALAEGRRPAGMQDDEALVYDFCEELLRTHGVCDATWSAAVEAFGEQGVIDLLGLIGYFTALSMVMNAAHTPPEALSARALEPFPR